MSHPCQSCGSRSIRARTCDKVGRLAAAVGCLRGRRVDEVLTILRLRRKVGGRAVGYRQSAPPNLREKAEFPCYSLGTKKVPAPHYACCPPRRRFFALGRPGGKKRA